MVPEPQLARTIRTGKREIVTFPKLGSAQVHVLDEGEGPAVVLSSGLAIAWFDWQDLTDQLLADGYRVICIDRPGAGLSGPLPQGNYPSVADQAGVIAQVLDAREVASAIVVGHSMGGMVAEAFARLYPQRCERLVLVDTSYETPPETLGQASPEPASYESARSESVGSEPFSSESAGSEPFSSKSAASDLEGERAEQEADGASNESLLARLLESPPVEELFLFATKQAQVVLTSSPALARLVSKIRFHTKRTPLRSARRVDEAKVSRAVFTKAHILSGMVREYAAYGDWVKQVEQLRHTHTYTGQVAVVAAQSGPHALSERWVSLLDELAGRFADQGAVTGFHVVKASHLVMRDIPQDLAQIIEGD
ncbi:alpha/beta hydrolase [Gleimia hominis]|uniref:Alpha/beta hydrolase n=1 Tax=Gleimia hominis TaxID=595468 RepID=A0ABU3IBK8_9ACTO|nr:alpha/beta hydrolase [Gleimia hominis]MDT3766852.1 alpha/beta hydrolase [Gleimia hominis]